MHGEQKMILAVLVLYYSEKYTRTLDNIKGLIKVDFFRSETSKRRSVVADQSFYVPLDCLCYPIPEIVREVVWSFFKMRKGRTSMGNS